MYARKGQCDRRHQCEDILELENGNNGQHSGVFSLTHIHHIEEETRVFWKLQLDQKYIDSERQL